METTYEQIQDEGHLIACGYLPGPQPGVYAELWGHAGQVYIIEWRGQCRHAVHLFGSRAAVLPALEPGAREPGASPLDGVDD